MVLRGKWKKLGLLALTGALVVGTAWAAANILEVPAGTTNGFYFCSMILMAYPPPDAARSVSFDLLVTFICLMVYACGFFS